MNEAIKELNGAIKRELESIQGHNRITVKTGGIMQWRIDAIKASRAKINELRKAIRILEALSIDDMKVENLKNKN